MTQTFRNALLGAAGLALLIYAVYDFINDPEAGGLPLISGLVGLLFLIVSLRVRRIRSVSSETVSSYGQQPSGVAGQGTGGGDVTPRAILGSAEVLMVAAFCPHCGTARIGQSRFCPTCAFDFDATTGTTPAAPSPPTPAGGPTVAPTPSGPVRWETPATAPRRRTNPAIALAAVVAVGVLIYLAVGVGGLAIPGSGGIANPIAAGWTRSANFTTCDQWVNQMTQSQREAMAGELLPILRRTVDSAASSGSELIPAFVDAITSNCQSPTTAQVEAALPSGLTYSITAAAAAVFTLTSQFHP